jgi:carbon-monoxide dehydrogenase small subunit
MTEFALRLTLNGKERTAGLDPSTLLVHAIREHFGLKGTHAGCLTGDCGACTVSVDGRIVKSCLLLAATAHGRSVETIESLGESGLDVLQQSFWDGYAFQCGYCLPGMLFAAHDLLARNPDPNEHAIREAIDGNLCRCTGYHNIVSAVSDGAARLRTARSVPR